MRRLRVGIAGISTWHVILLASLVLFGCHRKHRLPIEDDSYKLPVRVNGTSDKAVMEMMRDLNRGRVVGVISIGSDYLISIPSIALFPDESPQIKWKSYAVLNKVAKFLQQFRKVSIHVTSYNGRFGSDRREHALTLARARAVANYLWSQGVDSRFIFTQGAGSDHPISPLIQGGDLSPDSRIEITFRDTIV